MLLLLLQPHPTAEKPIHLPTNFTATTTSSHHKPCSQQSSSSTSKMTIHVDFSQRINGEYKIHDFLGEGHYSQVYRVKDRSGRVRAAKFVSLRHKELIEAERRAMPRFVEQRTHGTHYWYYHGKHGNCYVLVMDLLGKTVYELHRKYRGLCLKSILIVGIQLTQALKALHDRGFVHRDLQPRNYMIGGAGTDLGLIYLIDFGISMQYRDNQDRHMSRTRARDVYRSTEFSPCNSARMRRQSRKSDLESLVYNLVFLRTGTLPWMDKSDADALMLKESISSSELCTELPREVRQYFQDVKSLDHSERPNYSKLLGYLRTALANAGHREDNRFEWN